MCGLCVGAYGLMDPGAGMWLGPAALVAGGTGCAVGLAVGGRRVRRSRYRPDPWRWPEWVVAGCGLVPAVVLIAGWGASATGLAPSTDPLGWPTLPFLPAAAIVVAAVAAVAAPPSPHPIAAAPRPSPGPSAAVAPIAPVSAVATGPEGLDRGVPVSVPAARSSSLEVPA